MAWTTEKVLRTRWLIDRQIFEASGVRLADFIIPHDAPVIVRYEYDFGDSWTHAVAMTAAPREAGVEYPRCVAGSRSGPPEDVGGTAGYADFLDAWHDPLHEQHKDVRRWAGRKFDPERFDLDGNNRAVVLATRCLTGCGNSTLRLLRGVGRGLDRTT